MAVAERASIIAGRNAAGDGASAHYGTCFGGGSLSEASFVTTNDNWGWRARIGLFIVGNEAVPEAEWWAMAPPGVSVHAARVTARAPWARWRDDRKGVEPEEDLLRGCRQFAAMRLQAVVLAHSSSSLLGGKGWDEATVASLQPLLGAGAIVTTNGLDTQAALLASAVQAAVPGPAALVQRPDGGGGPALLRRSWLRAGRPPSLRSRPQVARPAAGRARRPRPGLRAGDRAALRADQGGLSGRRRRRADRRHRLSLRRHPGGARAGSEAAGDFGQPGEPLALPALGRRRRRKLPATATCSRL